MKATRQVPETWANDAYRIEMNGYERQMILGSLQRAIRHHESKAERLKTPGSKKQHLRTARTLAGLFNEIQAAR